MRTDAMADEFEKGYALGHKRGICEGRLQLLREDVLDAARLMVCGSERVSEEAAVKTMIRAAQRLLWEEAKERDEEDEGDEL
jgi:hypothetical protein